MLLAQPQQAQGQAVLVVQISFRFQHPVASGEHGRQHIFGGGLAGGAGDANDRAPPTVARRACQDVQSLQGVRHADQALADGGRIAGAPLFPHHAHLRAALQRRRDEIVAIEARAFHRKEALASLDGARIDGKASHRTTSGLRRCRRAQRLPDLAYCPLHLQCPAFLLSCFRFPCNLLPFQVRKTEQRHETAFEGAASART